MSDKCPPNYKNLGEIQSFSEQMYPTVQWAEQNCENDEYLKQGLEQVEYLTPPAVRKRFYPLVFDPQLSWGCQISNKGATSNIIFNQSTKERYIIDFDDMSMIDISRSTCTFETTPVTELDGEDIVITSTVNSATIPMKTTYTTDYSCRNTDGNDWINSFWYVGFDKAKTYNVRPDWLQNYRDGEIPSIVRAQTITIPSGITNGKWDSVDLQLENNGGVGSNWGSPLYVEVYRTELRKVEKTYWNDAQSKQLTYNPPQYETVHFPVTAGSVPPLAQCIYWPQNTSPHFQNFMFDKAVTVNSGEVYAIVMRSPLSHYSHCPRIGGWTRNCANGKYEYGDAFLSENNGISYIRYGRPDNNVEYRHGAVTPRDFAFQAHIKKYSAGRVAEKTMYLYLKPIVTNPIKSVQVSSTVTEREQGTTVIFEVSSTGKPYDWHEVGDGYSVDFSRGSDGEYPHIAFVRAKLRTDNVSKAPKITNMTITLDLDTPKEMYVRTPFYTPKTSPMLGANVWGRVYAPFTTDPSVTGSVEIVPDRVEKEHFDIITANELQYYTWVPGLDVDAITDPDLSDRYTYLKTDPNALRILKEHNIYVKPEVDPDPNNHGRIIDLLSFRDGAGIELTGEAAYPILDCVIQPSNNTGSVQSYSEYIDYSYDYDENTLKFYYSNVDTNADYILPSIPVGTLSISYNPVFINKLTKEEVGDRENGEGLILDYFKEDFPINDTELENRSVTLRVCPVDPIRKLTLNDKELREDKDFTVDYTRKLIKFPVLNVDNVSTILNKGDTLSVVYTPNLEDCSISIAYKGKRENKDKQMVIKPNYIEYKA